MTERAPTGSAAELLRIRRATADDAAAVASIASQPDVFAAFADMPHQHAGRWRELLGLSGDLPLALVAQHGHRVVGLCVLMPAGSNRRRSHALSLSVLVDATRRREGIASALLTEALACADNWYAASRIELQVLAANTAAIALYRKLGFETEGTLRGWALHSGRPADALAMARLRLDPPRPESSTH